MSMHLVDPGNPKYAGVYYRLDSQSNRTLYINYRDSKGRSVNERVGRELDGFNKTNALSLRKERVRAVKFGDTLPKDELIPTMDSAFKEWMEWAKVNLRYPLTKEVSRYRHHIRPYFGKLPLDEITPRMIERTKVKWQKDLSDASIQQVETLIARIYNKMSDLGWYKGINPLKFVKRTRAKVQRLRFLTRPQAKSILDYLHSKCIISWAQACFGLYAGLRPAEIRKLTPMMINLDTNMLVITNVKHATNTAKTRHVPIHPRLKEVILDINLDTFGPGEKIFPFWKAHLFKEAFAGMNKGISPKDTANWTSFYTFRHTFGTWLVEAGAHPKVIQSMMGHDTPQATEIYMKSVPDLEVKAMERLAKLWDEEE